MEHLAQLKNLNNSFMNPPLDDMRKDLVKKLKDINKDIKDFNDFMQAKSYNKKNKDKTELDRYEHMIDEICKALAASGVVDMYLGNKEKYFEDLQSVLKSDIGKDVLMDPFLKGSFKVLAEKLGRLLNPKEDDDPIEEVENLDRHVKQYQPTFDADFMEFVGTNNAILYSVTCDVTESTEATLKELSFKLCKDGHVYFGLSKENVVADTVVDGDVNETELDVKSVNILLASLKPIPEFEEKQIQPDEFLLLVATNEYSLIYSDSYISMDGLKRIFATRDKDTTQEFVEMIDMISKKKGAHFYRAVYAYTENFAELSEDNIPNILKGIVKSGEDYVGGNVSTYVDKHGKKIREKSDGVMATFALNGSVGNIAIISYWMSVEPIEQAIPQFDRDAYVWTEIDVTEFLANVRNVGELDTDCMR